MTPRRRRLWRIFFTRAALASLLIAIIVIAADILMYRWERAHVRLGNDPFLRIMEYKVRDLCFQTRGRIALPSEIVIVTVDERSVAQPFIERDGDKIELGRFPWPRRTMARLVDEISAQVPRVIAFDIMFTEEEQVEDRRRLAGIIAEFEKNSAEDSESMDHLKRLKEQLAWLDGDGALAESLERARARGVRGIVLPIYFIDAREEKSFGGHKLDFDSQMVLQVSAILGVRNQELNPWNIINLARPAQGVVANIPRLTAATMPDMELVCQQASVDNIVDSDGVLRREFLITEYPVDVTQRLQELREGRKAPTRGNLYLPLSLQTYALYSGWRTSIDIALDFSGILIFEQTKVDMPFFDDDIFGDGAETKLEPITPPPPLRVPLLGGNFTICFYGPPRTFPFYSALDVLSGNIDPDVFKDKIVFIGNTDIGHADFKPSPFGDMFPGVEKHATITGNLLDRRMLRDADDIGNANIWAIIFLCLAIALIVPRINIIWGSIFTAAAMAGYLAWCYQQFTVDLVWHNMTNPVLAGSITFVLTTVLRVVSEQAAGKAIKRTFEHFVDAKVVGSLLAEGGEMQLGGETREVSIFFSDIAGFTTISEELQSDALFDQLNEYLSAVTDILLSHNAFIDKYIGDAIVAGFGVPLASDNNARDACLAAVQAQRKIADINEKWKREGKPRFQTRMGINTGSCNVGLLGSSLRMDYSMIGDSVNLASRLEGINKVYGTSICISEYTHAKLDDGFLCRKLDLVRVKGKEKPITIFEVMGSIDSGISDEATERARAFDAALSAYFQGDFAGAKAHFDELIRRYPADQAAAVFLQRCATFQNSPPGKDWDGVFTMTTK